MGTEGIEPSLEANQASPLGRGYKSRVLPLHHAPDNKIRIQFIMINFWMASAISLSTTIDNSPFRGRK